MFTLENTSNDVKFHVKIIKKIFKVEPEPGPSNGSGSGSSQISRLRAAPAPKPWFCVCTIIYRHVCFNRKEFLSDYNNNTDRCGPRFQMFWKVGSGRKNIRSATLRRITFATEKFVDYWNIFPSPHTTRNFAICFKICEFFRNGYHI